MKEKSGPESRVSGRIQNDIGTPVDLTEKERYHQNYNEEMVRFAC